jgi:hypothetical protein
MRPDLLGSFYIMTKLKNRHLKHLAVAILGKLGNKKPTRKQINLLVSILAKFSFTENIYVEQRISEQEISYLLLAAMKKVIKKNVA